MPILYILTGAIVFYFGYIAGKPKQDKPMISFPFVPKVDDKPKDDKDDENINKFYA
jgi:hypothetical protein